MTTLDDIDLKILELLNEDGRLSHAAIGKEIGMTGPSVYARVQRLERDGIIQKYSAHLSAEKMGLGLTAFIRVNMQSTPDEDLIFEQFVRSDPRILECHEVDGEATYWLKVQTGSARDLRHLITALRRLPGSVYTTTNISLGTIKEQQTTVALYRKIHGQPEESDADRSW
ncbi:Lrp/AsnC family leucine-responsive transcriptional regulator [Thermosporothrix hazakensis]|jgi:Lrp/AsnC family leucine-responsive transcriptional regulator|uniref:Lrp/AsnC family leucine-responsive transcriptional regulator n=2 Tax=Thermosporothrix TaxID=768650 RepID=A0A326UCZ0_THEHA|nr:Lrp/AsnC family transcriptional regulator [Thermosporothrix hazakensis]PZW34499.1 Lrp/AsnC family leucine-responsive transcriptional regulator [Thermosporothrix hazakensis]BBH85619.1 AsnC family transcriptional regulator [Thermosporothrix sp. COM3]GCE45952.1 AsnC family transcriptional regulator [Thermosporothrix hazakensis]